MIDAAAMLPMPGTLCKSAFLVLIFRACFNQRHQFLLDVSDLIFHRSEYGFNGRMQGFGQYLQAIFSMVSRSHAPAWERVIKIVPMRGSTPTPTTEPNQATFVLSIVIFNRISI
jgi:hypothetical protein